MALEELRRDDAIGATSMFAKLGKAGLLGEGTTQGYGGGK